MLLTTTVAIKIGSNQKHFIAKGYDAKYNQTIDVKVEDLTSGSKVRVIAKCECGSETELGYDKYLINVARLGYYGCKSCSKIKRRKSCMEVYGVESFSHTEEYKDFMRENTSLRNPDTKNKIKATMLERYGVEHAMQSSDIQTKSKEACIKKYGVSSYSQTKVHKKTQRDKWVEKTKKHLLSIGRDYLRIDKENALVIFMCDTCQQEYGISTKLFYQRTVLYDVEPCTNCNLLNTGVSGTESKILDFITECYSGVIIANDKNVLDGKEIDIYLPEINLAFEYNGLYWHSEITKTNDYHLNKTNLAESKGVQLVHIYEDDWLYRNGIVKSRILNLLGLNKEKIYARKTTIKLVDVALYRAFMVTNHIQGYVSAQYIYGLYYNGELVSVMSFGKVRRALGKKSGDIELLRFANKLGVNVLGGASKLLKHFIKTHQPTHILTYADRSWSTGKLYDTLGFTFKGYTVPGYAYVNRDRRENRWNYRKDILVKDGYDITLTEHAIMLSRKLYRIYDSGNCRYELICQ